MRRFAIRGAIGSVLGWGAALLFVVAAFIAAADSAAAHAALVRSSPVSQAQLAGSPSTIDLWFSEPLEPRFSSFELYSSDGSQRPVDGIRVDEADDKHLTGLTRDLPPGLYTVTYLTLSTLDGHEWRGSFSFAVLDADGNIPAGSAFQPSLAQGNSITGAVGRWLTFLGLSIIVGTIGMVLLTHRSVAEATAEPSARRLAVQAVAIVAPAVVLGSLLQLFTQHQAVGGSVGALLNESRFGTFWLLRLMFVLSIVVVLGLVLLTRSRRRPKLELVLLVLVGLLACAALLMVAMLGHAAAAPGRFWAILTDYIHLVAAAVWVGGLVALASLFFVMWRSSRAMASQALLPLTFRFSAVASLSLYVLVATGVLRALGQLPSAEALTASTYGRWLLIKVLVVALASAIAFVNRRRLFRARLENKGARLRSIAGLRQTIALEASLGAAVLLTVAFLGQTPPIQSTPAKAVPVSAGGYTAVGTAGDLQMHFQTTPAEAGPNEIRLHVYRTNGPDPGVFERVRVTLAGAGSEGGDAIDARAEGTGTFVASGVLLNETASRAVTVDVQREGFDDARFSFELPVGPATATSTTPSMFSSPAPQLRDIVVFGLNALGVGLGLVLWKRKSRRGVGSGIKLIGAVTILASGFVILMGGPVVKHQTFPSSPESISRGSDLFAANCATCHGEAGKGDGPAGVTLKPPPADLTFHLPLHGDDGIFLFILKGAPGTAMPGWENTLSEQQIWDLVHYMRAEFAGGQLPAP